jgi:hypothetical protein
MQDHRDFHRRLVLPVSFRPGRWSVMPDRAAILLVQILSPEKKCVTSEGAPFAIYLEDRGIGDGWGKSRLSKWFTQNMISQPFARLSSSHQPKILCRPEYPCMSEDLETTCKFTSGPVVENQFNGSWRRESIPMPVYSVSELARENASEYG